MNTTDILLLVLAAAAAFWPKLGPILGLVKKADPAVNTDQVTKIVSDILAKLGHHPAPAPVPGGGPAVPVADMASIIQDILAKLNPPPAPAPDTVFPFVFTRAEVVGRLLAVEADLRANGRPRTAGLVAAAAADLLVEEPKTP